MNYPDPRYLRIHGAILDNWHDPAPDLMAAKQSRLQNARLLLLASGKSGLLAAQRLRTLPFGNLTIVPHRTPDLEPLRILLREAAPHGCVATMTRGAFQRSGFGVTMAGHHLMVVASDRPYPALLDTLNAISLRVGTAWSQISIWGAEITLGPTVIPHVTACYECYKRRCLANEGRPDLWRARDAWLRNDENWAFEGQLAPIAHSAIAYLCAETERFLTAFRPPLALGRILSRHMLLQRESVDDIIPVDACPACHATETMDRRCEGDRLASMIARTVARKERVHGTSS